MSAFEELYRRHAPDVFRFALYLLGDRADAEDITAETFLRAFAAPGPIRAATVKGWLFTIARNLFLQGLRRRRRRAPMPEDVPDPRAGPQARAELDSEVAATMAALQALSEVDRTALLMFAAAEMPYEEIARTLGISLAAVKVKIHRARLVLARTREP